MKRRYIIAPAVLLTMLGGLGLCYMYQTPEAAPAGNASYLQQVENAVDEQEDGGALAAEFLRKGLLKGKELETLEMLLRKEGTLPQLRQLVAEGILPVPPATLSGADGAATTPLQLVAGSSLNSAPDTLRWLFELGHSVEKEAVTPLNACVKSMQWFSYGLGKDVDEMIDSGLACLELLLERGARSDADTRALLPTDAALKEKVVNIMLRHGVHIMAGETCHDCCAP